MRKRNFACVSILWACVSILWVTASAVALLGDVGAKKVVDDRPSIHAVYGIPDKYDVLVRRIGYVLGYSNTHRQPLWVQYQLTRDKVMLKTIKRTNDFRPDQQLSMTAVPFDYTATGYDKGHMAPAADMSWNPQAMHDSFFMSNMSPQKPECNHMVWRELEEWTRTVASNECVITVVTGPIFTNRIHYAIGENCVIVPDAYYKILFDETPPQKMIGFVLPNSGSKDPFKTFACPVKDIERITKLLFFPDLKDEKLVELKDICNKEDWGL